MKKFLVILLIAIVASSTITVDTEDFNGFWKKVGNFFKKIGDVIKKLTGKLKDLYNWLKDSGVWDTVVDYAKKYGKPYAVKFCEGFKFIESYCGPLLDKVFDAL